MTEIKTSSHSLLTLKHLREIDGIFEVSLPILGSHWTGVGQLGK